MERSKNMSWNDQVYKSCKHEQTLHANGQYSSSYLDMPKIKMTCFSIKPCVASGSQKSAPLVELVHNNTRVGNKVRPLLEVSHLCDHQMEFCLMIAARISQ